MLAARSQRARVLPQLTRGARCCAPGCPEQQLSGVADSVGRLSRLLSRCVVRSLQHLVCLRQLASGTSRDASVSAQGCRLFAQAVAGCTVYLRESHRRRSVCAIFGVVRGRDVGVALAGEPEVGELRLIGSRSRLHPQHPPRLGDADLRRAACGVSSTLRGQRGSGPSVDTLSIGRLNRTCRRAEPPDPHPSRTNCGGPSAKGGPAAQEERRGHAQLPRAAAHGSANGSDGCLRRLICVSPVLDLATSARVHFAPAPRVLSAQ